MNEGVSSNRLIVDNAGDRRLSLDAWISVVAANIDGPEVGRLPFDLPHSEMVFRRAFVTEILGKTSQQRQLRKRLAKQARAGLDALSVIADEWIKTRARVDELASTVQQNN